MLSQRYPGQRLGLGVVRTEVEQGHLYVLYHHLPDGPVSVAGYGGDEIFGRLRAVRSLEVGDGQVWRTRGLLQIAAQGQDIPQPVEHPSVVRLDEGRAWESVEVREPDDKCGEVRQGDPGAVLDLFQPLAGDFILFPRLVHEKAEKHQRYVHEVVGV